MDWTGKVVPRSPNVAKPGYVVVPGWPSFPAGTLVGQSVGVEVDAQNRVFFFQRADKAWGNTTIITNDTVMVVDGPTGKLLNSWGKNMFLVPHGLTVDDQDHVWLTDCGLSEVFEFTSGGQLLQTLGTSASFNQPTDVAVVPGGNVYISDGYGNSRVAEFTRAGVFVRQWGMLGLVPGDLHLPHSVAYDGRLYVADRDNARIQVFDPTGALLAVWTGPDIGRPWGVAVGPTHHVFMIDGGDQIASAPSGRAVELDTNGKLVTNWGSFGSAPGQFNAGHAISVGPDGAVYVVEQVGNRIQKFVPAP
jgi:peptidylamidoglycolate lyase